MKANPEFTIHDLLRNCAARDPGHVAIVDGSVSRTFGELARYVDSLCSALLQEGVRKGDRVGIYMDKSWESIAAMLAAAEAGAAFVNINPLLKPVQVRHIMQDCDVRMVLGDSVKLASLDLRTVDVTFYIGDDSPLAQATGRTRDLSQVLRGGNNCTALPTVLESDLSTIVYTSGSTGPPRGVALTHHNVVVGAQIVAAYLKSASTDRVLSVLPFSFDYGLNQLMTVLLSGATLILQHSRLPGDLARSLREHHITGLAGVPTLWQLLLWNVKSLQERPLEHLRYITNSGGRIAQVQLDELRRCLPSTDIYLMYGLTEAFRSTYLPPEDLNRGSECIGKPAPNTEVWVLDRSGKECAPGQTGELVHRGPTVALGYWGKEEETQRVFRNSPSTLPGLPMGEKVVYSGDLVRRDEEGYLYFVGRQDQLIKSQGYRLSPEEVESLLIGSGLVREACVFGAPNTGADQKVVAVMSVPEDGLDIEASLRTFLLSNAPRYMTPKVMIFVTELPKTPSGKLDRKAIRDAYLEH